MLSGAVLMDVSRDGARNERVNLRGFEMELRLL